MSEIIKTPVTTYQSRCVKGAYVDDKGVGHEIEATGRTFKEGAFIERAVTENISRARRFLQCVAGFLVAFPLQKELRRFQVGLAAVLHACRQVERFGGGAFDELTGSTVRVHGAHDAGTTAAEPG